MDITNLEDITPEGSVAPVYMIPLEQQDGSEFNERLPLLSPDEIFLEQNLLKESAIQKLALLGLTEEEAKAIAGV